MINPTLSDLIGGIQAVTLGDEEARRRGTQKTVLERKAPPTFDVLVEINKIDDMTVYRDVAAAVDALLRGDEPQPEHRWKDADGQVQIEQKSPMAATSEMLYASRRAPSMTRERARDGRSAMVGRTRRVSGREARDGRNAHANASQVPIDERTLDRDPVIPASGAQSIVPTAPHRR